MDPCIGCIEKREGACMREGASMGWESNGWFLVVGNKVWSEEVTWLVGWSDEVREGSDLGVAGCRVNYGDVTPLG